MTEYKCKHCSYKTTSLYSIKSHAETHAAYSHNSYLRSSSDDELFDTAVSLAISLAVNGYSVSDSSSSDSFSGGGGDFGGGGASGSWD